MPKPSTRIAGVRRIEVAQTHVQSNRSIETKQIQLMDVLVEQEKLLAVLSESVANLGSNIERFLVPHNGAGQTLLGELNYSESPAACQARNNNERINALILTVNELTARAGLS